MPDATLFADALSPKEEEANTKLINLLKKMLEEDYPKPKRMLRDAHPKMHGLVKASFIVEPNLPEELRVGVFAEPKSWPTWVRFSNMSAPPGPDGRRDSRGMALKLMGVPGEKILPTEKDGPTQDFVMMSSPIFVTRHVVGFEQLVAALMGGKLRLGLHMLTHPRVAKLFLGVLVKCPSALNFQYWSVTPYRFGDRIIKFTAKATTPGPTTVPENPSYNFLREQMVQQLSTGDASFDFMIQFRTVPEKMPVDDPTIDWSVEESPFIKVATVHIPQQTFDTEEQNIYGDNLSFTPWHALPVHQPLGGINIARRRIYETMSAFRHAHNDAPNPEPTSFAPF